MNIRKRKITLFILAAIICSAFIVIVFLPNSDSEKNESVKVLIPEVSVIEATTTQNRISMSLMGEMKSEQESIVTSRVEGEITFLSNRFKEGVIVKKGELLAKIENSAYRLGVSEAELRLSQAELELLREKNEADEALLNWKNSGLKGAPDSPLVLRKPYVAAAEKEVTAASDNLKRALQELAYTEIRSPVNGIIVIRSVSIGGAVFAGNEIAVIYGVDKGVVTVNLNMKQWGMLPANIIDTEVTLVQTDTNAKWPAAISRVSKRIIQETRQRQLFIEIDKPLQKETPLLPGTFLTVKLTGKTMKNSIRIPESALTRKGEVWFVSDEEKLFSVKAEPLYRNAGEVCIQKPEVKDKYFPYIAIAPNSSFVNGRKVQPTLMYQIQK